MNEAAARKEGLQFEGGSASPWDAEECKELRCKAAEIRKLGFRAIVVQSGANEWGGGSKLLYVEPDYSTYKWVKENEAHIEEKREISWAEEQCRKIMEEARLKQDVLDKRLADARAKLAARSEVTI